jgi:hypothetical protein
VAQAIARGIKDEKINICEVFFARHSGSSLNPSYLGGKDSSSRPAGQKVCQPPSQLMAGRGGAHLSLQLQGEAQMGLKSRHKVRPYLKNHQKRGWQSGSSGKAPNK